MNPLIYENGSWELIRLFYKRGRISTEIEIPDEWLFDSLQDHMPTDQTCIFKHLPTKKFYDRFGQPVVKSEVINSFKRSKLKMTPSEKIKLVKRVRQRLAGEFQHFNAWFQSGGTKPETPVLCAMLEAAQADRDNKGRACHWSRLTVSYQGVNIRLNYRIDHDNRLWLIPPRNKIGLVEICESSM